MRTNTKERFATYIAALPVLLPQHEGKFALVCDGQVSVHETAHAAWDAVIERCADPSEFLIIRIEPAPESLQSRDPDDFPAVIEV